MRTKNYTYEADWRQYAFPEQTTGFASDDEIEASYTIVDLDQDGVLPAGGLPVYSDGHTAIINTENEHTLIYGATASGKTRKLILPLMGILAKAKESMVVLDIKGELSDGVSFPEISGILDANGYQRRYFDLRDMDGDAFNILLEPYKLYKTGHADEAIEQAGNIIDALAKIYKGSSADPFWEQTARQYLTAVIILLFELCNDPKKINMHSVAAYTNWNACEDMRRIVELIDSEDTIMTMLHSVTDEPEKTRMSTLATVNSMLTKFLTNKKLLRMLSQSTFSLHELSERPTVLFIIVPDEVDTFSGIVGLMLEQICTTLVQDAYKHGGKLPIRVNMLCDEFNNYYVPNTKRAVSAHRSRNLRWYIVSQSQKQLQSCYPDEADTIMANCTNLYFLNTPELSLMEYLSHRAGTTTVTPDGTPRPILSVSDLLGLKKGWTHTDIYFTAGNIHYVSKMPDISEYAFLSKTKKSIRHKKNQFATPPIYSSSSMLKDAQAIRMASESKKNGRDIDALTDQLSRKFDQFFGNI